MKKFMSNPHVALAPGNHLRLASNWLAVGMAQKGMPNYGKLSTRHFSVPNPFRLRQAFGYQHVLRKLSRVKSF
jgi:hypothetical protein